MKVGAFAGYASVFHRVDRGGDRVLPGAFQRSIAQRGARGVRLLWQHDPGAPIGVIDEIGEDGRGLFVKGRLLLDVGRGRDAHALLRGAAIDGLSIGYRTLLSDRDKDGVRNLREIDLWEVSLVTFPMQPAARVALGHGAKSADAGWTAVLRSLAALTARIPTDLPDISSNTGATDGKA